MIIHKAFSISWYPKRRTAKRAKRYPLVIIMITYILIKVRLRFECAFEQHSVLWIVIFELRILLWCDWLLHICGQTP